MNHKMLNSGEEPWLADTPVRLVGNTSLEPTFWKDRIARWHALCVWPKKLMTRSEVGHEFRRELGIAIPNKANIQFSIRMYGQRKGSPRFEAFVAEAEVRDAMIQHIKNHCKQWHCKARTQVEARAKQFRPRRKHHGRFSIMSWNANQLGAKYQQAKAMIERVRPAVVVVQETMRRSQSWMFENGMTRMGMYAGFEKKVDPDSTGKNFRGLMMLMDTRCTLRLRRLQLDNEDERMLVGAVTGFESGVEIVIINLYAPCRKHTDTMRRVNACMEELERKLPNAELVVVGDWNTRLDALNKRLARYAYAKKLRTTTKGWMPSLMRQGARKSDIDHCAISSGLPEPKTRVMHRWLLSDHCPLITTWTASKILQVAERRAAPKRLQPRRLNEEASKIAYHNRFAALSELEVDDEFYGKVAEAAWLVAEELKCVTGGKEATRETKSSREESFLNNRGRRLWRKLRAMMKRASRSKNKKKRAKLWGRVNKLKPKAVRAFQKATKESRIHWHSAFRMAQTNNDPSAMFAYLRSIARGGPMGEHGTGPIRDPTSGALVTDPEAKANLWVKNFADQAEDYTGKSKDPVAWEFVLPEAVRTLAEELSEAEIKAPFTRPHHPVLRADIDPNDTMWAKRALERQFEELSRGDEALSPERVLYEANDLKERRRLLEGVGRPISTVDVGKYLRTIARRKSPGLDGVTNEFWKCAINSDLGEQAPLLKCLMKMIEYAWESATIFEEWNAAVVVPVPKKGDLTVMGNYRGIALMPCALKIINGIFAERLMSSIVEYRLMDYAQAGFVNREEAVAQAAALIEIVQRRQAKSQDTWLCFIDLAKAYDSVPHEALLAKAERFGISGRALQWLKALYARPTIQCRKADGGFSQPAQYRRGVRQGDPLSPALFDIFMDGLLSREFHQHGVEVEIDERFEESGGREKVAALLYADDIVLMAPSLEALQELAGMCTRWCDTFEMNVNAAKCGVMRVKPWDAAGGDAEVEPKVEIQRQSLPSVESYTYLGIEITPSLSRERMIEKRIEVCRRAIAVNEGALRSPAVPLEAKAMVIRAIIQPTLTYGSEIWGEVRSRVDKAEAAVAKAMRMALRAPSSVSLHVLRSELKLKTIWEISSIAKARLHWKKQMLYSWFPRVMSGRAPSTYGKGRQLYSVLEAKQRGRRKTVENVVARHSRYQRLVKAEETRLMKAEDDRLATVRRMDAEGQGPFGTRLMRKTVKSKKLTRYRSKLTNAIRDSISKTMRRWCKPTSKSLSAYEKRYDGRGGPNLTRDLLLKLGAERVDLTYGWTVMHRVRLGRYWTADRLRNARMIEAGKNCPFCGSLGGEDVSHYVFICDSWSMQRMKTMGRIVAPWQRADEEAIGIESKRVRLLIASVLGLERAHSEERWSISENGGQVERIIDVYGVESMSDLMTRLARFFALTSMSRFKGMKFLDTYR